MTFQQVLFVFFIFLTYLCKKGKNMVIEYAKYCLGFKPKKKDLIDVANEFCDWAKKKWS
jgi:hypothetical protein